MAFHIFVMSLCAFCILTAATEARPSHFDANQQVSEGENVDSNNNFNELQWNLLRKMAQLAQMEEYSEPALRGWERGIRSPENKRQSRYRQCYFNPVSCFRK